MSYNDYLQDKKRDKFFEISLLVAQPKNNGQNQTVMVEKICPKEFLLCLLIKDESFGDSGQ